MSNLQLLAAGDGNVHLAFIDNMFPYGSAMANRFNDDGRACDSATAFYMHMYNTNERFANHWPRDVTGAVYFDFTPGCSDPFVFFTTLPDGETLRTRVTYAK
jgi:hypothetical protein